MSHIRIQHLKGGEYKLVIDGVDHPMPKENTDVVIRIRKVNWSTYVESNYSNAIRAKND